MYAGKGRSYPGLIKFAQFIPTIIKVNKFKIYSIYHSLHTSKFLAERLSSRSVRCPLTVDVAATGARLPWIKDEAWPVSISN